MAKKLTPRQVARQRKQIRNKGGSVSTERSITVGSKKEGFRNIPTIRFGKQLTARQAVNVAKKDKISRPIFKTQKEAVESAMKRSKDIGKAISRRRSIVSKTLSRISSRRK